MEAFLVVAAVAVLAVVAFRYAVRRAVTIAEIAIEDGELRVVRGGLAPGVLSDLRDVAGHARIESARIRIVRSTRHAVVELEGSVTEGEAQQIRNVIGSVPLNRLAPAGRR